jgi:signal transduction histidine kinase
MQTDFIRRIKGSALQMQDLVLNLLEMARIEMESGLKKGRVDLKNLLQEIGYEFQNQAQLKIIPSLLNYQMNLFCNG